MNVKKNSYLCTHIRHPTPVGDTVTAPPKIVEFSEV